MNIKSIIQLLLQCSSDFNKLHDHVITELSKAVNKSVNEADPEELFKIAKTCTPTEKDRVQALLNAYNNAFLSLIKQGITQAVLFSTNTQQNALSAFTRFEGKEVDSWRKETARTFIESRMKRDHGLNLSDRVWNYTQQTKSEFEVAVSQVIANGIGKGISAESLGRQVRQYLNNPDMMYRRYHRKQLMSDGTKKDIVEWRRRVIDKEGKMHFVKEDLAKVGTGVYRSARQNALRLTITETNMAYNYSNCKRWEREPFVLGIRIRLSANHPAEDICDELAGDYPKTFMWRGWHPRCMCSISPILMDRNSDEWKKLRKMTKDEYEAYKSPNLIEDVPSAFSDWCKRNEDKLKVARDNNKLPYFVRDNEKVVGEIVGWKTKKELIMEAAKARHDARTPEKEAMLREYWAKKVSEGDARRHKEAVLEAAKKRQEARTQVQKDDIQSRWNAFVERNRKIQNMSNNVLKVAKNYPQVSTEQLQKYLNTHNFLSADFEARIVARQIVEVKDNKYLSQLIPDIETWKKQFTSAELHQVYDAVKSKLQGWAYLSYEEQKKKLQFEAYNFLGNNMNGVQQKYNTWKVSQAAYINRIEKVQNAIDWTNIVNELSTAKAFKTKSKPYATLISKLEEAISNQDKISANSIIANIQNKREALQKAAEARASKKMELKFKSSDLTQARKDAAIWHIHPSDANDYFFTEDLGKWWNKLTTKEKKALYGYTAGSAYITEPLRGIDGFSHYYTRRMDETKNHVELMTKAIQRMSLKDDTWLKRDAGLWDVEYVFGLRKKYGVASTDQNGVRSTLLDMANKARDDYRTTEEFKNRLNAATTTEARNKLYKEADAVFQKTLNDQLVGLQGIDRSFMSCGDCRDTRFECTGKKDVIYNIYAPKGTHGVYAEPFSAFGEKGIAWDGVYKPSVDICSENEVLLQRGTRMRITKVEYNEAIDQWYVDVEVLGQNPEKIKGYVLDSQGYKAEF